MTRPPGLSCCEWRRRLERAHGRRWRLPLALLVLGLGLGALAAWLLGGRR